MMFFEPDVQRCGRSAAELLNVITGWKTGSRFAQQGARESPYTRMASLNASLSAMTSASQLLRAMTVWVRDQD
eukprot:8280231-Heterocapsa_arctica.AAC.1